jgi:trans-aconitate methyltransferase
MDWNPSDYAKNARFVSDLGEPVLALLNARPGETILDLGCGDGALTEKIAGFGCSVYGIDASFAQARASRLRGLTVLVMDGRQLCFKKHFDAVFTNAVLHWINPPGPVVNGVWNCLKPTGRFIGEFGGHGNVQTVRSALHAALRRRGVDPAPVDPWYYPTPREYSALLEKAGFTVERIGLIPRPTKLPGDILDWLAVFAQPFLAALPDADRQGYAAEVRAAVAPAQLDQFGAWNVDYVRLRFAASKPAR